MQRTATASQGVPRLALKCLQRPGSVTPAWQPQGCRRVLTYVINGYLSSLRGLLESGPLLPGCAAPWARGVYPAAQWLQPGAPRQGGTQASCLEHACTSKQHTEGNGAAAAHPIQQGQCGYWAITWRVAVCCQCARNEMCASRGPPPRRWVGVQQNCQCCTLHAGQHSK